MRVEKRRAFIINFAYWAVIVAVAIVIIKYGLSLLSPFVIGAIIAYLMKNPIRFMARKTRIPKKICALAVVLVFFCTVGALISILGIKLVTGMENLFANLPVIYENHIEAWLFNTFDTIESTAMRIDPAMQQTIADMEAQFIGSLGELVSGVSVTMITKISEMATSLPGLFIKLVLLIISAFFIATDYDRITGFCLHQMGEKAASIVKQVEEYIVGTLFVVIRSYAIIMTITFTELTIGLSILKIEHAVIIAACIAVFDILPVLGTGGIMIPWTVITFLQGNIPLGFGLLLTYVIITIVRNIIEPKIVGKQLGLHPIVTLSSMFAGVQLFGGIGLFGFPIGLSLMKHLNDRGTIHVLKSEDDEK